jgi:hypothetical protein
MITRARNTGLAHGLSSIRNHGDGQNYLILNLSYFSSIELTNIKPSRGDKGRVKERAR